MHVLPSELESTPASLVAQDVDANGVDLTLVRYTLSLTPTERLKALENFMNAMTTVRRPTGSSR
jgi:hypothetical protein